MEEKFTHNGIDFDLVRGLGEVPNVIDIDYLGFVAYIRPSVFLALCPPVDIGRNRVAEAMAAGRAIGMPFLIIDIEDPDSGVIDHEGRHRMSAILDIAGDEPMPVAVFPANGRRARHVEMAHLLELSSGMRRQKDEVNTVTERVDGPIFERARLHGQEIDLAATPALAR